MGKNNCSVPILMNGTQKRRHKKAMAVSHETSWCAWGKDNVLSASREYGKHCIVFCVVAGGKGL